VCVLLKRKTGGKIKSKHSKMQMLLNRTWGQKVLNFPLTKIVIGLAVCLGVALAANQGIHSLWSGSHWEEQSIDLIGEAAVAMAVLTSYFLLYRKYENRKVLELATVGLFKKVGAGIVVGALLQSLIFYVIYLCGDLQVFYANKFLFVLPYMASVCANSITAEILLIGIIFRITEQKLGTYLALLIFAFLFGIFHMGVPNATLVSLLGIAMHAAFLLGAAYVWSRSLWFPIAIHFAWDFTQSGIYGASVMGKAESTSLLMTKTTGSSFITGGYFGPQGSVESSVFCLIFGMVLIYASQKQQKIKKPYWVD
jgi:uncharacterized protein